MSAYDLERLDAAGPKRSHHEGKVETDGPWLILHRPDGEGVELLVPAHAVVVLEPCTGPTGRCPHGRE